MFWSKFVHLCNSVGKAPNVVASEIGIKSSGTVTGWKNGASPRPSVLLRIADFFGVSVDYFFDDGVSERDDKKDSTDSELQEYLEYLKNRPEMRMLFKLSKDCTKAEVEQAVRIIEALRKND